MLQMPGSKQIVRKIILTCLLIPTAAIFNQISAQSEANSVKDSRTTQNADDLADCSQMLDKTLDALKTCEDLANKRLLELYTERGEKSILEKEVKFYENLVAKLEKRIEYLESKKCSQVSIFWVVKWKWC